MEALSWNSKRFASIEATSLSILWFEIAWLEAFRLQISALLYHIRNYSMPRQKQKLRQEMSRFGSNYHGFLLIFFILSLCFLTTHFIQCLLLSIPHDESNCNASLSVNPVCNFTSKFDEETTSGSALYDASELSSGSTLSVIKHHLKALQSVISNRAGAISSPACK